MVNNSDDILIETTKHEKKKRKFLDKLNKEINSMKLLDKNNVPAPADVSYYDSNVQGMVKARVMYLRIYEGERR